MPYEHPRLTHGRNRLKAAYAYQTGRMIHDAFKKNPLTGQTFSLDVSFGTSKSYSHMESTTHEYAGSRIASGGNTNVTAGERDLTVKGSTIEGKDMSLTAKGNVRLEAGENTSITTTENKFSSASIGASFTPQGLSNISVNASKGNGNSKESVTAYSPTLVVAENTLSLTSGKDMDIIGSRAQGDKITAKVGGNLNIETLQEKETYEEQNSSTGFGFSWGVKAKDKQTSTKSTGQTQNPPTTNAANSTPKPNGTQVTSPTGRKFFDPTIGGSRNKGTVDSHYRSARDQAGFFAGSKGFDIYARENTDLKGGIIASNAPSDKNHLSTGTFSFSDLKNEADYSAKSTGSAYHKYGNYDNMSEDEQNKVFNTIGLAPVLPMPVVGSADSTTKAAVAPAAIDIRENPTQDISALSRDTVNALNELGRIFDKQTMEERQELAAVFGEEAFRLLHNMKDNGSVGKIAAHAAVVGILSQITGNGFTSGAADAGLNEALIKSLKGLDPGLAQMISGLLGAAAKVAGGNALARASAAISGTKWNFFGFAYRPDKIDSVTADGKHTVVEMVKESLVKEDGSTLSEAEAIQLLTNLDQFMMEQEPEKAKSNTILVEKFSNIVRVADRLHSLGYTEESVNHFLNWYTSDINITANGLSYFGIGDDGGFVGSEYIGKDFQFPNYIYDRSSVQSKQNPGIYGWKYVDDILVGINKNGDIFLDEQHKPVIWEADVAEHPFATKSLKDKIDFVVKQTELFPTKGTSEDFQKEVDQGVAHYVDPADVVGVGRLIKGAQAVKPLTEPLVERLSKVASDRVINELKAFRSKVWTVGNQKILLDKSGMKHILERHHPAFWAGKTKPTQTFLSPKTSVKDIEYTIQEVIFQNRDVLSNISSLSKKQIEGVIDGVKYVVGFTRGRIGQFYIKE